MRLCKSLLNHFSIIILINYGIFNGFLPYLDKQTDNKKAANLFRLAAYLDTLEILKSFSHFKIHYMKYEI